MRFSPSFGLLFYQRGGDDTTLRHFRQQLSCIFLMMGDGKIKNDSSYEFPGQCPDRTRLSRSLTPPAAISGDRPDLLLT